jgi:HK97 family phage prohead protease
MTALIARIEGYASIFNAPDMNGDVVMPGAFKKALRQKSPAGVKMLYQHLVEAPIGRWTHFAEDGRGLYAVGELILETQLAKETHALAQGGALDGLSIGYQTVKAAKNEGRASRFIVEADLWEVSIVTFPMAPGARLLSVGEPFRPSIPAQAAGSIFADALLGAARIMSV